MNENPFLYDVENLSDGDFFSSDLIAREIPKDILNLVTPDFAICFKIIPVAFDSYGTLYIVTTADNFDPTTLFTIHEIEVFLSEKWNVNCRVLIASEKNIQAALKKYYNFSEENLKKALIKFYDFDRLTFNNFDEVVAWAKKYSGKVIKNSLIIPPVSDSVEKVVNLLPAEIAIRFSLIPVEFEQNEILVLVTSSSRTFDIKEKISEILQMPCKIFLTLDENIRAALEKFYHFVGLNKKRKNFDFGHFFS